MDVYAEASAWRQRNPEVGMTGFIQEILECHAHPGYKDGITPLSQQEKVDLITAHVVLARTETFVVPRNAEYLCDPTPMWGFETAMNLSIHDGALGQAREQAEWERGNQATDSMITICGVDPWPVYACILVPRPEGTTEPTRED